MAYNLVADGREVLGGRGAGIVGVCEDDPIRGEFGRDADGRDIFTQGEGIAGHPVKWGYKPVRACRTLAQSQIFGMTPATDPAALLKNPAVEIALAILFLVWVLR